MNITKITQTMLTEMTILYVDNKSYYVSSEYTHTFAFAFAFVCNPVPEIKKELSVPIATAAAAAAAVAFHRSIFRSLRLDNTGAGVIEVYPTLLCNRLSKHVDLYIKLKLGMFSFI